MADEQKWILKHVTANNTTIEITLPKGAVSFKAVCTRKTYTNSITATCRFIVDDPSEVREFGVINPLKFIKYIRMSKRCSDILPPIEWDSNWREALLDDHDDEIYANARREILYRAGAELQSIKFKLEGATDLSEFREYLTKRELRNLDNGKLTIENACGLIYSAAEKRINDTANVTIAKVRNALKTELPDKIRIDVVYTKGRDGSTAEADVYANGRATGKAAGCGFDLQASAIVKACNQLPVFISAVAKLHHDAVGVKHAYKYTADTTLWYDNIGLCDGADIDKVKYLLDRIGYHLVAEFHPKNNMADGYVFSRK
jgi:hypothetical protein